MLGFYRHFSVLTARYIRSHRSGHLRTHPRPHRDCPTDTTVPWKVSVQRKCTAHVLVHTRIADTDRCFFGRAVGAQKFSLHVRFVARYHFSLEVSQPFTLLERLLARCREKNLVAARS